MAGWIKIDRDIRNHWIWKDPVKYQWWMDILMEVNHIDKSFPIGYKLFVCKRGECLMSLKAWANRWNVSKTVVNNFFTMLENDNMIETENETVTTRITVCNYDSYQEIENAYKTQTKRKRNATVPQQSTTKEGKEREEGKEVLSKDNKICISRFEKYKSWLSENCPNVSKLEIQMTEANFEMLLSKYDSQKITDKVLAMENKKDLTKKYKSVYLTLNTWLKTA